MDLKPLLPPVIVNGREIPADRIAAEAQNHPAPKGKPGLAWRAAARALALRDLMLEAARARGLHPAPRELEPGRIETADEALIRQLLETVVTPEPVDDAALRAAYEAAPGRFRAPALYEAAHILIPAIFGDGSARARARALAERLITELAGHPDRFAVLAREHSACASRDCGGRLGQITAADVVPEFATVLARLAEGEMAPAPVESRFGVHVIRLDARAEGAVLPFASVAPRLRAAAEKAAWVRAARAFADRLVADARIDGIDLTAA